MAQSADRRLAASVSHWHSPRIFRGRLPCRSDNLSVLSLHLMIPERVAVVLVRNGSRLRADIRRGPGSGRAPLEFDSASRTNHALHRAWGRRRADKFQFPAGTTSAYNRLARGGGGIELLCGKRHSLDFACRWWHISNANLGVRDLEFNGIQVGFGYHWLK
jgi:hypothetical protein